MVRRRIAVGDDKREIVNALEQERVHSDILILTGGLGPTSDDITKPLLCEYFDTHLIENAEVREHVVNFFKRRNRPMPEVNYLQAMVPANCTVLFNAVGTAPGMLFHDKGTVIISLPGVPSEMQYLMLTHVLPVLKQHFQTTAFQHRTLMTVGEGESMVAQRLMAFEKQLPPNIKLAYLPQVNIVKLRLSATDVDEATLDRIFVSLQHEVDDICFAHTDTDLETVIGQLLCTKNNTLSMAESCTGGTLAARITSVKGSSAYFTGGIVVYSIAAKQNVLGVPAAIINAHGVVSEETVRHMAEKSCRLFQTDFALSVSGYLEPGDHDNIVWVGLSNGEYTIAKRMHAPFDRQKNTVLISNAALNLLRLFILDQG